MRNTITIIKDQLVVEPVGLDKMWSFTGSLRIPLGQVRGATHDPGMRNEPKGIRAPGLRIGQKLSGTFHTGGEKQFWNVSGYENVIVIELAGQEYNRLILSVDDPTGTVDQINSALPPS